MSKWRGISYFPVLANRFVWWLWERLFCPREWHLFDEVESDQHYLYCDACGLSVYIDGFEEESYGQ